jgi:hypothetical protein
MGGHRLSTLEESPVPKMDIPSSPDEYDSQGRPAQVHLSETNTLHLPQTRI